VPTKPRKRGLAPAVALLLLAIVVGAYLTTKHFTRITLGGGCTVRADGTALALNPQQASIAATIAGVAHAQHMPSHAVQIAYAAAMQESKLQNLPYGDRDSVGVFQQRPSQGWGPRRKLLNPVYASTKFFQALAAVPGYGKLPVYQAAQAVQRSADGSAYIQYQPMAGVLATAFTGHADRSVWCWPHGDPGKPRLASARRALLATFGHLDWRLRATPSDAPSIVFTTGHPALGWAVAAWLVTHAGGYGIRDVRYDGYTWLASAGRAGWRREARAGPSGQILAG
jgi:hypothetical protein